MAVRSDSKAQDIISQCRKDMERWFSYFSENIISWREDMQFYFGEQWTPEERRDYIQQGVPTLVHNHISPIIRKAQGKQKQADITANLYAKNDDADTEGFDLIKGLVRYIFYKNNAPQLFGRVYEHVTAGGYGVITMGKEYEDPYDFAQVPTLGIAEQPTCYFFDPDAKNITKSDGNYCGGYEIMSEDDFKSKYPNAHFTSASLLPESCPQYTMSNKDSIAVVLYYVREYKTKTLVELSNNVDFKKACLLDNVEEVEQAYLSMMEENNIPFAAIPPLVETNRRRTQISKIKCYKMTATEILESYDWEIDELPYKFVPGDFTIIDGKEVTKSFVSHARDPQRFYNFVISQAAYDIKIARKERFLATDKHIEGHEDVWRNPNNVQGRLPYNPDLTAGGEVKPSVLPPSEISQAYFQAAELASADVQKTMGRVDPKTGSLPNMASGQAIGRTIEEQNLTLINYEEHLSDAIAEIGRSLLKLIPKIYDTERVISIMDDEGNQQRKMINGYDQNDMPVNHISDLVDEVYDIEVGADMSIEQELLEQHQLVMALAQNPDVRPFVIDLLAKTSRVGIAPELLSRLEYLVPDFVKQGLPQPPPQPQQDPMVALKQQEMGIKHQQLANQAQSNQMKHVEAMTKAELENREMYMEGAKADLQAQTEIQVAHDNNQTELMKSLAEIHKAMGNPGDFQH